MVSPCDDQAESRRDGAVGAIRRLGCPIVRLAIAVAASRPPYLEVGADVEVKLS